MKSIRLFPLLSLMVLPIVGSVRADDPQGALTPAEKELAAGWLKVETAKTTPARARLLERAQSTLLGNIVKCDGWKPYRGIMPSLGTYRGVWNWDSAFHAVALSHWDPPFAREQFSILFDKQQANGMLPDVIWENGTMVTSFTKPPVMAWAVAVVDRRAPDDAFLRGVYPKLAKLGEFWMNERGGKSDGLFYYAGSHAGNESGWDNSIRWDGGYQTAKTNDKRLWAIDLNCYMVSHYRAMAYVAGRLGLKNDQAKWTAEAHTLAARINDKLWDESIGSYVDVDRVTGKSSPVLSAACFMPLFVHIAPADRAAKMAKLAADPKKFHPAIPTAAYDTPNYSPTAMWRGPAWMNTSYFALKGLREYGCASLVDPMRETLLGWITKNGDSIREYYDAKSGQGLAAKAFGWSAAFTVSFILDWDNDNLTWMFDKAPALSPAQVAEARAPEVQPELELTAAMAKVEGGARLDGDMIQHWDDVGATVSWQAQLMAGEVEVLVVQAAEAVSAGNLYQVEISGRKLQGTVRDTGGWKTPREVSLGKTTIDKNGEAVITLRALKKGERGLMNLKGIVLRGKNMPKSAQGKPAERGVYFQKKTYEREALPTFGTVKDQLPEPVLASHPDWTRMYWKCWELAFSHLRQPKPGSPLVSNWLDEAFSANIFQWDTCFMMMFARYGHYQFPSIQSLDNFYALQRASGFICREYVEADGTEFHWADEGGNKPSGWKNTINPPIFAWAETETFKVTGDKSRFSAVLPVLEKYVEWLNRDGDPNAADWENNGRRSKGTPHELFWNTGLGCGMDNTPKPADKGSGWVDMSCQMVMQYNDIATMHRALGNGDKAAAAMAEGRAIAARINQWCWDEKDGFYYDINAKGEKFRKMTSSGFWPLIAGVASKEQAARLVAHLKDPHKFNRPVPFPTLAADEKEYRADGGYWLGGVWAPTNYVIVKGLERYGYDAYAAEVSETYLRAMADVFAKTGTVWENYAPESMNKGNPSKGDFVGWSGCGPIALLIENVLGFRPDGSNSILRWDLRLKEPHGIKRLRFGSVTADLFYDGKGKVTVRSSAPFQLIVGSRTMRVEKGECEFTGLEAGK